MKRALGTLTWAGVMLALAATTAWVMHVIEREPSPLARKIANSERLIYYVVRPEFGPSFRLSGGERSLRIVSHAALPAGTPYDPAAETAYGIRATLWSSEGEKLWEREVHTRSRQSKADPVDGRWLEENAFSLDDDLQVTDDRVHVVHLPDGVEPDSLLVLSLTGEAVPQAFARVYQVAERSEGQRRLRLITLGARTLEGLDDGLGYVPWDQLGERERLDRLRFRSVLMTPIGEEGADHETRTLYVSGFRLPREDATRWSGRLVRRGHAVAINVEGPARLTLRAWRAAEAPGRLAAAPDDGTDARLTVRVLAASGLAEQHELLVPPGLDGFAEQRVPIPAGVATVSLESSHAVGLRTQLLAHTSDSPQFGSIDGIPHPGGWLLVPEARRSSVYRLEPDAAPLVVRVEGGDDVMSRVFRIETRYQLDAGAPLREGATAGRIRYVLVDDAGREVGAREVEIASPAAPFEQLDLGDDELAPVTEPVSFRLVVPRSVRELRLTSTRAATARVMTPLAGEPRLRPPFDRVAERAAEWRYAPRDFRFWHGVRADNHPELLAEGRWVRLETQVRLEARARGREEEERAFEAIEPVGRTWSQLVHEPTEPPGTLDEWTPTHHTPLAVGEEVTLDLGDGARPTRLAYSLSDPSRVGGRLEIRLEGEPARVVDLVTASGSVPLATGASGRRLLRVESDVPGLGLHVDRPRVDAEGRIVAPVLRQRALHRLDDEPLRFRLERPAGEERTLSLILYGATPDAMPGTVVRTRIDGGDPPRVAGEPLSLFSVSDWSRSLPASREEQPASLRSGAPGSAGWARRLPVFLGADVEPGEHVVELELLSGEPLWVRAYATLDPGRVADGDGDRDEGSPALQWSLVDPDLDG